jgi:hypothetical protein
MARTEGSGWGNGMIRLYQICPLCGKKKVIYKWSPAIDAMRFHCTNCRGNIEDNTLKRQAYAGEQNTDRRK